MTAILLSSENFMILLSIFRVLNYEINYFNDYANGLQARQ